jgi:GTP cyclohydrolase IA
VVDVLSKRLQVQERLTTEIADTIEKALEPRGVFVLIEAEHLCMTMRGVKKPGSMTVTSAVRGLFRSDARTRQEALHHIGKS